MKRVFLYIDILGFGDLVKNKSNKIEKIFKVFDKLNVFKHGSLKVIIFSDTILVFNKEDNWPTSYFITYLIEYVQELFYNLSWINVYFKGIITLGKFNYKELSNFKAYYGEALIETYEDEQRLEGFGLYINKNLSDDVVIFNKTEFNERYDYILLCQSLINLYKFTSGVLPINIKILQETDTYFRIDEDLRFLREIEVYKNNYPNEKIRIKCQKVFDIYKEETKLYFEKFEVEGILPFTLNKHYTGSINPFELLAEKELNIH